ncbi:unnamed protein product [Prorocentrum cordatum]|uniref:Folate receptor-like domain-containing protein n=1 Tax=Prorocentrum cordatum TaxID=2364126 RepID=A0ABN9PAZ3_9DINO|nr:unnamed protein product [Polarella glacialis]
MARATPPVATARAARAPRLALLPALAALRLTAAGAGPVPGERGRCSAALGFSGAAHHGRTCCEGNHTREALVRYAPFSHSASGRCGRMTRLAMCSPCDGDVGTGLKSQSDRVVLCPDFCARWFDACRESFYEAGRAASALSPCGQDSLVCSRLGEITEDPRGFCESIGPYVVADGGEPDACYDGVPAASSRGRGPKA